MAVSRGVGCLRAAPDTAAQAAVPVACLLPAACGTVLLAVTSCRAKCRCWLTRRLHLR
jgi:hypothetical protein